GPGDAALAEDVATAAGKLVLRLRADPGGLAGRALGDAGDAAAHRHIVAALLAARPGDAVLSEEGADDPARLAAHRVWIVDPVDGTREFADDGRTDWAVHVALAVDGVLACGAVALPAQGITLSSARLPALPPRPLGSVRIVASRSRAPAVVFDLASELGGEVVHLGSAGAKAAAVVTGQADAYVHAGGQWEWDVAAPAAVAGAAGLHVSRLDGSPLAFNQPRPWSPDLLLCRPELAPRILELLSTRTWA
ncbi:MAG TPA: inositol monophosphatase family protein, partial [Acidimicrobiales bacterium]|nr:inositol monophosphatase family protein [Acidimicrobiales bacterium]